MTILHNIKNGETGILAVGNHPAIIQSTLDFDFLSGKKTPSILGIVMGNRKTQKFFFGKKEILIPCFASVSLVPQKIAKNVYFMLNVQSGRRVLSSTISFFDTFPHALGGTIFAENVPEKHATELLTRYGGKKYITGPASVGVLVPGHIKLGAIGGVDLEQISAGKIMTPGNVAVGSTSGGMTNELIRALVGAGKRISFASAVGGDRFPVVSLTDLFRLAESDKDTNAFVYFGELGGMDEYEIVELIKTKKYTKPLVAYIAGMIDESFKDHMQFGHAKALVRQQDESARAKREALRAVGVVAPDTFPEFLAALGELSQKSFTDTTHDIESLKNRKKSILSTRSVVDIEKVPTFIKNGKLIQKPNAFSATTLEALLGRPLRSPITSAYAEAVFMMLIDHGGNVSGAVNTMITARAGKDLVSSLVTGLLTVGPRFGGAVNGAAHVWLKGVSEKKSASQVVSEQAEAGELIQGIGHKKYRVGMPDPRVKSIADFTTLLKKHPYYDFAREVEKITTAKNGSLILNVDGAIAALLLDVLSVCEGLTSSELQELADAEFFNAFFVIPRTVGFISHFIEQRKNDEGLFRLPDELLFVRNAEN